MLNRLSIRSKLTLLAGVPVLGALALASLLWMQAQRGEKSAAALGSVEDLAELSVGIAGLVQELQSERAIDALVLGYKGKTKDPLEPEKAEKAGKLAAQRFKQLKAQRQLTDSAIDRLNRFLKGKNLTALPVRLRHNVELSRKSLAELPQIRAEVDLGSLEVSKNVEYFAKANEGLINAAASLTQLSDDGDLLRSISALVSVMQLKERASQEHALLASVFALGMFPPGTYRSLVRLTTEEQLYVDVLRSTARDEHIDLYEKSRQSAEAKRADAMRQMALDNIDEDISADAAEWFAAQAKGVDSLRTLESQLTAEVRAAAATKLMSIRAGRRTSLGLSALVLAFSTFLAVVIARGIAGSVGALTGAAAAVQKDNDFSVRAVQQTHDELGQLTVAFNEMLGGIQERDKELDEYRQDLEKKVDARTKELRERNAAMRLVLDNVDQGLATIRKDGTLAAERSAAFNEWFGDAEPGTQFGSHLAKDDSDAKELFEVTWDEVVGGFFPLDLTLGQLPKQLRAKGRLYTLEYKPILQQKGEFEGALLVATDVTEEEAQRQREAERSEQIAVFEHLMRDRAGFIEFFKDGARLVQSLDAPHRSLNDVKADVHTLKGNCAVYSITSVAKACHEVEGKLNDSGDKTPSVEPVVDAWKHFAAKTRPLMAGSDSALILQEDELEQLIDSLKQKRPHHQLVAELEQLRFEPLSARFFRVGEQAKRLAKKLGKPEPLVVTEPNGIRLPLDEWSQFWSVFTHVIRNAVDHGLEPADVRLAAGKKQSGSLHLSADSSKSGLKIRVRDDGGGIDWEQVRKRAQSQGLASETQEDLVSALFTESFTTKETVTETSGRGVGLAALWRAVQDKGGRIDVESIYGEGTTFSFSFPATSGSQELAIARGVWNQDAH